jgi:hypothetical protein
VANQRDGWLPESNNGDGWLTERLLANQRDRRLTQRWLAKREMDS